MRNFLLIFLALFPFLVNSQGGLVRIELEAALNSNIYQVVPCDDRGILVFFETKDFAGESAKSWYFTFFNPELEESWNVNIPVLMGVEFKEYILKDSILFLFFMNSGKIKSGNENYDLIRMDLAQGVSYNIRGVLPAEADFRELIIEGSRAYVALNVKNEQAGIYFIDLGNGSVSPFQIIYPDQNFIDDIVLDKSRHQLLCVVNNYLERKQNKMMLLVLDTTGRFIYDLPVMPNLEGKSLNTGRIYCLPDTSIMILGAYGNMISRIPNVNEYFGVESAGLFSTRFIHNRQDFIYYYNFMEFNNLKAGVSARDYYRLQKKKVRETNEYSVNYELLFHDPIVKDSSLVLLMEAFYPEFRTVSDISYDYWGRPVTQTYTVFDGFRIFNTILAGFGFDGELKWDNSLEVNISPSGQLLKRSASYFDGEPSLLFYNDGFRLSYRVYLENTELVGFSRMDLETSHTGDRITAAGFNTIIHWYDQYFLAYGYHSIQNNLLTNQNERTVFYINKIALD